MKKSGLASLIIMVLLLSACGSSRTIGLQGQLGLSACAGEGLVETASPGPAPFVPEALSPVLRERLPERTLMVAHATGMTGLLEALIAMKDSDADGNATEERLRRMALVSRIQQRLSTAALEVSAAAAEMDCEEERADQLATYLSGKEADAETRLTVAAIVVGALGGIVAGTMLVQERDDNAAEFVGVGASIIGVGIGAAILMNHKRVRFTHERNALGEVWHGVARSTILPPSVWYYLNQSIAGAPSLREQLVTKWRGFGQAETSRKADAAGKELLYYGNGGTYGSGELANRANMYDQLESTINLMHQDILRLARFVEGLR